MRYINKVRLIFFCLPSTRTVTKNTTSGTFIVADYPFDAIPTPSAFVVPFLAICTDRLYSFFGNRIRVGKISFHAPLLSLIPQGSVVRAHVTV